MRLVLCLLVCLLGCASAGASTSPRLVLVGRDPAVVAGAGFHGGERVSVQVSDGARTLRHVVVTSPRGAFTARWQTSLASGCESSVIARAVGNRGSRATLKISQPECAPLQPTDR